MRHYHHSPNINWQVTPTRMVPLLVAGWAMAGMAGLCYWWFASEQPIWLSGMVGVAWLGWTVWAVHWVRRRPERGVLRWQAGRWSWQPQAAVQPTLLSPPQVVLDLQHMLAVRWPLPQRRYCFLWLQCGADPAQWEALRRAVYSSAFLSLEGA